jgi:polyphenol oxidase
MSLPAPFRWAGEQIAIELPGGRARFTTRRGGVSTGPYASLNLGRATDDDPAAIEANRERLAAEVGLPRSAIVHGHQVHGTAVHRVTEPPEIASAPAEADGLATVLHGVAPFVLVADCLPIVLVALEAVAVVHAGWRGLAAGVIGEGVAALRELGAGGEIAAAIGPGARRCCYETGDEVHAAFAPHGAAVREGDRIDLPAIAGRELAATGVAEIHDVGICTICSDPVLFFSHRRDRGVTGRQVGIAWRS